MKKVLLVILVAVLVAVVAVAFVACDNKTGGGSTNGGSGGEGTKPEGATFTVTFNADGELDFSQYTLTGVLYGSTVRPPVNSATGEHAIPYKKGYTFKFWSADGEKSYDFSTPVTSNLTLTAVFEAKKYSHNLAAIDPNNPNNTYTAEQIVMEYDTLTTTFDSDAVTVSALPSVKDASGNPVETDYFLYFYYYDKDGKRVALTQSLKAGAAASSLKLNSKFSLDETLTLYPMFYSQLPVYEVEFAADKDGASDIPATIELRQGDTIDKIAVNPTHPDYDFLYWYYEKETEDSDGNTVTREVKFVFFDTAEGADNSGASAVTENIVKPSDTSDGKLVLKAKWVRKITVSSAQEFETFAQTLATVLSGDDETAKAEYLNANIHIESDLTLTAVSPLYNKENAFNGTLYGGNHTINVAFVAGSEISLLGANSGTVKELNVVVTSVEGWSAYVSGADSADSVRIAGIAAYNYGTVEKCTATLTLGSSVQPLDAHGKSVYAGALVATAGKGSNISGCTAETAVAIVGAERAYVGGMAGTLGAGTVNGCDVNVGAGGINVVATAEAYAGGVAGRTDNAKITSTGVSLGGTVRAEGYEAYAGGVTARAGASTLESDFVLENGSNAAVSASGTVVRVGGIVGRNEAAVSNCKAFVNVTAESSATRGSVYAGGAVGYTINTGGTTSGNVAACYFKGTVTVTVADGSATEVNAGAAIGRTAGGVKCGRLFVNGNVVVVNKDGTNETGVLVGRFDSAKDEYTKCYVAEGNGVTLNGAAYVPGEDTPVIEALKTIDASNYDNWDWVGKTDNLALDGNLWEVVDGKLILKAEKTEA